MMLHREADTRDLQLHGKWQKTKFEFLKKYTVTHISVNTK